MRQRGFGWVEVIISLAVIGIVVAVIAAIYQTGKKSGVAETTAAYSKRDNDALKTANVEIKRLEDEARSKEQRQAERLAAVSANYQKDLANAKARKDRDVAAARAGSLSLRFRADSTGGSCPGGTSQVAPGAGGRDGGATAELPRQVAADLLALADDADETVKQLAACQEIVRKDRE